MKLINRQTSACVGCWRVDADLMGAKLRYRHYISQSALSEGELLISLRQSHRRIPCGRPVLATALAACYQLRRQLASLIPPLRTMRALAPGSVGAILFLTGTPVGEARSANKHAGRDLRLSLIPAKKEGRPTPRLRLRQRCRCEDGKLCDCRRPTAVEDLLLADVLPSRGGGKRQVETKISPKEQWTKDTDTEGMVMPSTPRAATQRAVTGNVLVWATVVGGSLAWSRAKTNLREGIT